MVDISTAYFDQVINSWALGYDGAAREGFVAELIAPFLPVDKQSGAIGSFGQELFDLEEDARAPKSRASQVSERAVNAVRYFCQGHGKVTFVADEARANWGFPSVNLDQFTTENIMQKIKRRFEYDWKVVIAAGVGGATLSGTGQWSDYTNSDPAVAIAAQRAAIELAIGMEPDTLVVSYPVHLKLQYHPVLKDMVKYTQFQGPLPNEMIGKAMGVARYIVARAKYNTANEGQTPSKQYIWGNDALLCYSPASFENLTPRLAATALWTFGMPDAQGVLTRRWREEPVMSDAIEGQMWYDKQLLVAAAGYYWTSAVA